MKKISLVIITGLVMVTLVVVSFIAVAEEQVKPGTVKRDIVIRVSPVSDYGVNYFTQIRSPEVQDRIKTYYEKGDSTALREMYGVLLDMMFEYTHPRIILEYIDFRWGPKYEENLMATIAVGTPPSLFPVPSDRLYEWVREGIIADITDYVKTWKRYEKAPKASWDWCTVKGRIYGYPVMPTANGVLYRRDYFKEAGIFNAEGEPAPPDNWTMEDFIDICNKIAGSKKDRYGCSVGPGILPSSIDAFGDFGVKPDPTGKYTWRADFDSPGKRYFEWLRRLLKSGSVLYGIDVDWSKCHSDHVAGRTAIHTAGAVNWPPGWIVAWGPDSHGEYTPGVKIGPDIGGAKLPAGPEGINSNPCNYGVRGVASTQTKEQIEATIEWARWCIDEDPNIVRALQSLVWYASKLGNVPPVDTVPWWIIERPPIITYDTYLVQAPNQPNDWSEMPELKFWRDLHEKIMSLPSTPLPAAYGVYIPTGSIGAKLSPVYELLISNPDADIEKELSKAANLINSTILNYKDEDITKKEFEAYYTALGEFYKENYPEYYNKYYTKLLEERYKIW